MMRWHPKSSRPTGESSSRSSSARPRRIAKPHRAAAAFESRAPCPNHLLTICPTPFRAARQRTRAGEARLGAVRAPLGGLAVGGGTRRKGTRRAGPISHLTRVTGRPGASTRASAGIGAWGGLVGSLWPLQPCRRYTTIPWLAEGRQRRRLWAVERSICIAPLPVPRRRPHLHLAYEMVDALSRETDAAASCFCVARGAGGGVSMRKLRPSTFCSIAVFLGLRDLNELLFCSALCLKLIKTIKLRWTVPFCD